jgi:hypothetical protein
VAALAGDAELPGAQIRLFDRGEGEHRLQLPEHRVWQSGLVQLRYVIHP